jgi:predicted component of type VI protein secretion system
MDTRSVLIAAFILSTTLKKAVNTFQPRTDSKTVTIGYEKKDRTSSQFEINGQDKREEAQVID